jgi:hypothetical protein
MIASFAFNFKRTELSHGMKEAHLALSLTPCWLTHRTLTLCTFGARSLLIKELGKLWQRYPQKEAVSKLSQ